MRDMRVFRVRLRPRLSKRFFAPSVDPEEALPCFPPAAFPAVVHGSVPYKGRPLCLPGPRAVVRRYSLFCFCTASISLCRAKVNHFFSVFSVFSAVLRFLLKRAITRVFFWACFASYLTMTCSCRWACACPPGAGAPAGASACPLGAGRLLGLLPARWGRADPAGASACPPGAGCLPWASACPLGRAACRGLLPARWGRALLLGLLPARRGRALLLGLLPARRGRAACRGLLPARWGGLPAVGFCLPAGGGRSCWGFCLPAGGGRSCWGFCLPAGGGRSWIVMRQGVFHHVEAAPETVRPAFA